MQTASGVAMEGGTVFTYGRTLSLDHFQPQEIVFSEINRRGRALKEEKYPAKDGEDPVKMIRSGKEFIAISNLRGGAGKKEKQARLSWHDLNGKYKREKLLQDKVFDYEAMGLVQSGDSSGFIVIIRGINRHDETDQNGILIKFTPGGELLWKRSYRPGIPNVLHNLVPIKDGNYIAVGRIRLDDGRMAGWAMKLGFDGAIHWQRIYPRGSFSVFHHAALSALQTGEGKGFILSGNSKPYDGNPEAAWVMAIDALGEPLWQRYYRRPDYGLQGQWIVSEPDGRLVVIMNAKAVSGEGHHDHVRMLTLTQRGVQLADEAYYEGRQTRATDYVAGWNGERILTAVIEDDRGEDEENGTVPIHVVGLLPEEDTGTETFPAEQEKPIYKGWVFVATALDPYDDPCHAYQK